MIKSLKEAESIAGPLGTPSKMPGYSYGLSAKQCKTGSVLRNIENSVCSKCYALKGRYVFPNVTGTHDKRLEAIRHPRWVEAMIWMIRFRRCRYFRWHDSGDIQDVPHLIRIVEIARKLPNVKFWLPTREEGIVRRFFAINGEFPPNLVVRVSASMIDGAPSTQFQNTSTVTRGEATCKARDRGNVCGRCRMCWDPQVKNVSYPLH